MGLNQKSRFDRKGLVSRLIFCASLLLNCASFRPSYETKDLVPAGYTGPIEMCAIYDQVASSGRPFTEESCDRDGDGEFDFYRIIPPGFRGFHEECQAGEFSVGRTDLDDPCFLTDEEVARIQRNFVDPFIRRVSRPVGSRQIE